MKKEKGNVFSEFEKIAKENAQRIYAAAYAVKGNTEEAEAFFEDMIFYGAKRSCELVNKKIALDIMLHKIGNGTFTPFDSCDLDDHIDRAVRRANAWYQKKKLLTSIGVGALSMVLCVMIVMLILPKKDPSQASNVILMENASVVKGDNDHSELVNYQNICKNIPMNEEHVTRFFGIRTIREIFTAVTAPDGTPYAVLNHLETIDGSNTTFTLYRGYKGGWDPVATAEIGAGIDRATGFFIISDLYIHADKNSDVYVFCRVGTEVQIYKYDSDMETFEKKQSFEFREITYHFTINVQFDESMGERGVAYIACNWAGSVKLWRYDVATDTLSVILDNIELATGTSDVHMSVWNDVVYIAGGNGAGQKNPMLFRVHSNGTVDAVALTEDKEIFDGIVVDREGTVHIIGRKNGIRHYVITDDLDVSYAPLEQCYYQDTDYYRTFLGLFKGGDGNAYLLEAYSDTAGGEGSFLACGALNAGLAGENTFVNGYDMLDNYEGGLNVRIVGTDVVFPTYAYHDVFECYLVYFHLNELSS